MSSVENFLSLDEEQEIVQAIVQAERNTSGEIRVHIERTTELSHYDRALEVFQELEMHNTEQKNAVLIYIAVDDHKFVIYGDKGINDIVPKNFWESTKNVMQSLFIEGKFKQGIVEGVLKAGHELKEHFPRSSKDIDELPNEVSKG
ncbi:TLP18.3/Psb32/MOLO-1 phosphatase superfamily protein [Tenacibaculum skagerrakense]|uniref:TLP18.3/Psb32/MOLO-1 phosphatase superfamily protein n=1 Tax=Tenacibaculum skagerrakense TaxID=186571 RepID=A0A4R2NT43_9FLAO|nr:TPM domain-containing protein [Tenacibaculum skagerrakense]TCP25090.1 TLP18.3/Psb32/MOLO-1 phosphatase superfamily protein [Tenacibaculum skagerrakense]